MLKSKPLAAFAACLAIACAGCGGGGGGGRAALDTLLVTDAFVQNQNGSHSYERTRCSHDQCTFAGVEVSIDNLVEAFAQRPQGLSNTRVVEQILGIEIMELLEENRDYEGFTWGAELDHVSFASVWAVFSADDSRFSYSGVVGQASGYAPKIAAQYNGAWTTTHDHENTRSTLYHGHGAAALLYSITDTGSYIDAFFYNGTDIASEDVLERFQSVNVNALGKFKRHYSNGKVIEGSFFGGEADEAAGIFEWNTQGGGGYRVLGAFGAERRS